MNTFDYSYIAGFFDGEGSAMILTIKRIKEENFRFRPVIKISQKNPLILKLIRDKLGFGTVLEHHNACLLQINGNQKILRFIKTIGQFVVLKKEQLNLIEKLIKIQYKKNKPYNQNELIKIIDIRDAVHKLNAQNRKNIKLKYSKGDILCL